MINQVFDLVYSDPAWHFKTRSSKGEGRSAKKHYKVMTLDEIKRLPLPDITERNSVMLMWAIDPMLDVAFDVLKYWGFKFKTVGFYWVKQNIKSPTYFTGLGYYTRANPEICLLATRGKGLKRKSKSVKRLIVSPRQRHSQKPDIAYERIEELFGDVSRLEMFSRSRRIGWEAWGNEIEDSFQMPVRSAESY